MNNYNYNYNNSNNAATPPKYNMRTNPVYQVNFTKNANGKTVARTKRHVTFAFGFSNPKALNEGLTGMHCRGEEHEVIVVWSLTSGKRSVMVDGQEVHFSQQQQGKQRSRTELHFECSWTMKGNHHVKLVANATPPAFRETGTRSFELFLDGLSYFAMPKIYELGIVSEMEIESRNNNNNKNEGMNQMNNVASTHRQQTTQCYSSNGGYHVEEKQPQRALAPGTAYVGQNVNFHTHSTNHATRQQEPKSRRAESAPMIDLMSDPTPVCPNYAAAAVTSTNPACMTVPESLFQAQPVAGPFVAPAPPAPAPQHPVVLSPYDYTQRSPVASPYRIAAQQPVVSPSHATFDPFAPVAGACHGSMMVVYDGQTRRGEVRLPMIPQSSFQYYSAPPYGGAVAVREVQ